MDNNKSSEVYISYDVEDSSVSSFISYLIAAFDRQGISVFFDGKSSDVEAAEKESEEERFSKLKIFVVIFSKNFASHVPHLEKCIYSCRNSNNNFMVVPVFYYVSITSVEQYLKNFSDAFKAIQRPMPKLGRCHEYDGKRSESEFQEEIARDVFENLYPTDEIGIQSIIQEIESLLCNQPWGVRTIGIFGVLGIGKTTLARAVFRRMFASYDDSCFFKDFQTEYNQKKLKYLPNKYLSDTPMEKFDINCSDSEPCHRKKRVLIALDDVRNFQNAKSFLGGFGRFGPGSLIIITSRYKTVLQQFQMNEIYELKGLKDEDARKLFARCAFGKDFIEENLLNRSMEVIESCGGNPSALRSHAKKFKDEATVKNTLTRIHPYEGEDELQPIPSHHNAVLATKDPIILTAVSTKDTSNQRLYRLDYQSVQSFFHHLRRNHRVLHQKLASQLEKLLQRFSTPYDLDQLEVILNFSDGVKDVRKKRKLNSKGFTGIRKLRSGKFKHDRGQGNGLGVSN